MGLFKKQTTRPEQVERIREARLDALDAVGEEDGGHPDGASRRARAESTLAAAQRNATTAEIREAERW